jgi:hypothetical protein
MRSILDKTRSQNVITNTSVKGDSVKAAEETVRLRFSLVLNPTLDLSGDDKTFYLFREPRLAVIQGCVVR